MSITILPCRAPDRLLHLVVRYVLVNAEPPLLIRSVRTASNVGPLPYAEPCNYPSHGGVLVRTRRQLIFTRPRRKYRTESQEYSYAVSIDGSVDVGVISKCQSENVVHRSKLAPCSAGPACPIAFDRGARSLGGVQFDQFTTADDTVSYCTSAGDRSLGAGVQFL